MKKLIKYIFKKAGYIFLKDEFYKNLVNVNTVKWLDFHYLLKDKFASSDKLIIFDIGANVGQTALKFNNYYPKSNIYCFEPIKSTFDLLQKNIKDFENIQSYNFAFGDKEGEEEIYHREDSEWNSLVSVLNERAKNIGATSEVIKVETIDNFLTKNFIKKIHILKSDTEGFEMNVINGAINSLTNQVFEFLYMEVGFHRDDKQHSYLADMIQFLEKYNYRFSGLFEKAYLDNFTICYANALFTKC